MSRTAKRRTRASIHSTRFPGETAAYRAARDTLLRREMALRDQIEAVATLRRKLPLGGVVPEDYVFEERAPDLDDRETVTRVRLSELFEEGKSSLIVYSFMYGPNMAQPCASCTSILDSLDGAAEHVRQRVNFVVVAKSPLQRIREFARSRGWRHLRLLSSAGNTYNRDYHGETADGSQMPSLNVFVRRGGKVRHFYNTELLFARSGRKQGSRHVDLVWPLWNLFDVTPEGRGTGWYPSLTYQK